MEKVKWNTGRNYSENGQRIVAWQDGETIFFQDIDRGIGGKFAHPPIDSEDFFSEGYLKTIVMLRYDNNSYDWHYDYNIEDKGRQNEDSV